MTHPSIRPMHLVAEAGPRVRAPRKVELPKPGNRSDVLEHPLGSGMASVDTLASSVSGLFSESASLVSTRPLDGRDPIRHLTWLVPSTIALPIVTVLVGVPWWVSAGVIGLGAVLGVRWTLGLSRRVAVLAREVTAELEHGVSPLELADEIERLVTLDTENDAARLVLAHVRIEQQDFVGALLQLAPLRDRHPDDGAIVLLAAVAYARMGSTADALRMLDALRPDASHPWCLRVQQFRDACAREIAALRASGGEFEIDPVQP